MPLYLPGPGPWLKPPPPSVGRSYLQIVSDSFTDADGTVLPSHTGELGATWTLHPSYTTGQVIRGNRTVGEAATNGLYYASATPSSPDYDVEGIVRRVTLAASSSAGIAARIDAAADTYYYFTRNNFLGSGFYFMGKVVAGVNTFFSGAGVSDPGGDGTDETLRISLSGSTITFYLNGVQVGQFTDTAITTAGKVGVLGKNSTVSTGFQVDSINAAIPLVLDGNPQTWGAYYDVIRALGPGLYWRMGEGASTEALTDVSGNNRDGFYGGAAGFTFQEPGQVDGDKSTKFPVPTNSSDSTHWAYGRAYTYQPFASGSSRTFVGLAKIADAVASGACELFAGTGLGAAHPTLEVFPSSGQVLWFSNTADFAVTTWPAGTFPIGQWVHYSLTYNATTFAAELFINGFSEGSGSDVGLGDYSAQAGYFEVGARDQIATTETFNGWIDDTAVFESILTAGQIADLAKAAGWWLQPASGISSGTLNLTVPSGGPAVIPLQTATAQSSATLVLTAATTVTLAAASGVSSATLTLTAPTTVVLGPASGVSSATLVLFAPARLTLSASGISSATLFLTAATKVTLGSASSVGSATLALSAPTTVVLSPASAVASTTVLVTAQTTVVLGPSSGVASATVVLFTPRIVPLDPASAQSSATLFLTAPARLNLSASGQSSATLFLTAQTQIPLVASSAVAAATLLVTAQTRVTLGSASAQSSATLALTAPALLTLAASGVSSATLTLTATTQVVLGAASGVSSATAFVTAQTYITLASASAVSSATLVVTIPGSSVVPLFPANAVSSATLTLTAIPRLTLSADALASTTLQLTAATRVVLQAASGVASASAVVYIPTNAAVVPLQTANAIAAATLVLRVPTGVPLQSALAVASAVLNLSARTYVVLQAANGQSSGTVFVFIPEDRWNDDGENRWNEDGTLTRWDSEDEGRMAGVGVASRWSGDNEDRW